MPKLIKTADERHTEYLRVKAKRAGKAAAVASAQQSVNAQSEAAAAAAAAVINNAKKGTPVEALRAATHAAAAVRRIASAADPIKEPVRAVPIKEPVRAEEGGAQPGSPALSETYGPEPVATDPFVRFPSPAPDELPLRRFPPAPPGFFLRGHMSFEVWGRPEHAQLALDDAV